MDTNPPDDYGDYDDKGTWCFGSSKCPKGEGGERWKPNHLQVRMMTMQTVRGWCGDDYNYDFDDWEDDY